MTTRSRKVSKTTRSRKVSKTTRRKVSKTTRRKVSKKTGSKVSKTTGRKKISKKLVGGKRKTSKRKVYKNKLYDYLTGGNPDPIYDAAAKLLQEQISKASDIYALTNVIKNADPYIWNPNGPNAKADSKDTIFNKLSTLAGVGNGNESPMYPGIKSLKDVKLLPLISNPGPGYINNLLGLRERLAIVLGK